MDTRTAEIVVGVDGSEQSMGALHWAAREARRRGAPLHMVTAYSVPMFGGSTFDVGYAAFDDAAMNRAVEDLVGEARRRVAELDVDVRSTVQAGDPSSVLLELSEDAQLLVLGSRGWGGLIGRLLGSVSTAVPAHAHCPVGIIPLQWGREYQLHENVSRRQALVDGVTVGSDGSQQASSAMLWAAEEAEQLGVPLTVVCAAPSDSGSCSAGPPTAWSCQVSTRHAPGSPSSTTTPVFDNPLVAVNLRSRLAHRSAHHARMTAPCDTRTATRSGARAVDASSTTASKRAMTS